MPLPGRTIEQATDFYGSYFCIFTYGVYPFTLERVFQTVRHPDNIIPKESIMLASDRIAKAFEAICEEVEKIKKDDLSEKSKKRLKTIVSIAKHQSDIRGAKKGGCTAHEKKCA